MRVENTNKKKWIRPWDGKPDGIYDRDDRFFSLVIKGALAWLTKNIKMYGKPIRHFVFNTGSSYMYVETNGYEYNVNEITGQDEIYQSRPRCIVTLNEIEVDTAELTQPYVRGTYERFDSNTEEIKGYNAEIRRLPVDIGIQLQYVLSTFNEELVLVQELLDKICFQQYYSIIYLGEVIKCSIEFPTTIPIEFNKIDMSSSEPNNKVVNLTLRISTSYPSIDEATEIENSNLISSFKYNMETYYDEIKNTSDIIEKTIS